MAAAHGRGQDGAAGLCDFEGGGQRRGVIGLLHGCWLGGGAVAGTAGGGDGCSGGANGGCLMTGRELLLMAHPPPPLFLAWLFCIYSTPPLFSCLKILSWSGCS